VIKVTAETDTDLQQAWHPVASGDDVPARHVFHGQLLGRELAVWRADDGFVNVWENRCLHRGVRLSIGMNDGRELQCQYHGWRYANRTGGCTYIPAHPADAPARTICNRTFPSVERYGLVWSGSEPDGEPPVVSLLEGGTTLGLRNMPINAPSDLVMRMLDGYAFQPSNRLGDLGADVSTEEIGPLALARRSAHGHDETTVVFFVQPVDSERSVVRPVMTPEPPESAHLSVLHHHNTELSNLRDEIEAAAQEMPAIEPMVATIDQVSIDLAGVPERSDDGRSAPLRVSVSRKWVTAEGVAAFELVSLGAQLPTFQPGAHIDLHLPNGLIRQYSLTNGPGELEFYRIGVKLEPDSRGGSASLHESVREGDVLAISEPRNNFALRRDAERTVLIAGGIGLTPLLAMAQTLHHSRLPFELHYFAQSDAHVAFDDVVTGLGDSVTYHLGLTPEGTGDALSRVLTEPDTFDQIYVCGPGPMLDATRQIARDAGWRDEAVHFEYFKNAAEIDDSSSFELELARSALTLEVPSGSTILDVLRANGVAVPSSCEQGACGTCAVGVIDGEPDHQDVYLNDTEHRRGDTMMVCVSRARGDRLVLDI
jgi:ferredoxin-NADP reductase/nitrite reductase/ring-hydroxylating ferredoxin subunit